MKKASFPPPFSGTASDSPTYVSVNRFGFDKARINLCEASFGTRGDIIANIRRYLSSPEYTREARIISSIDEIPELSFCNIEQMMRSELKDKETIDFLMSCKNSEKLSSDQLHSIYIALGLIPGHDEISLNRWLVNFNVLTAEELKAIECNEEKSRALIGSLIDYFSPGFVVDYGDSKVNNYLITQGRKRYYFRGENAYFGSSKASYFRDFSVNSNNDKLKIIIRQLRIFNLKRFLSLFDIATHWPVDVNAHAIAQHYGFPTNLLDITSDLDVALFFACCKYDRVTKRWLPLSRCDYEFYDSRKWIADKGGDSRYAVLYRGLAEIIDWAYYAEAAGITISKVMPIGYQPFMRCSFQCGYTLRTDYRYDMYKDSTFEKFRIRLTAELCEMIYDKMEQGQKIYPHDGLYECEDILENIRNTKSFCLCDLEPTCKQFWPDAPVVYIRQKLESEGFKFNEYEKEYSPKRIRRLNGKWNKVNFRDLYGFSLQFRPIICVQL
jgi:hypothetical protein